MTYLVNKAGDLLEGIGDFASRIADRGFAIIDNILSDPKKLVAVGISIAFPGAGSAIGAQLGLTGTMATIVGNTALGSLANGGNIEEALKGAVLSAGAQELTNNLKIQYASEDISRTLTDIAAKTTTDVALATIMGKDPAAALLFGGVQAATQVITDTVLSATGTRETYDKLPKAARDAANAALSAVISGKDVAGATAQSIVNSAIRGFSGAINIQNSSLRFTGKALDEKDLEKYVYNVSSDALANPTRAEDYFLSIEAAENYFGRELGKKEVALIAGLAPYKGELSTAEMFERLSGLEYSRSQLLDQVSQTKGWEDYNDQVTAFSTGYQDPNSWRNYLNNNAAIQTGWDSGGQEQYFNTRFNKSNSSDVANVLDDLAKITSGLSDGDRQWIIGQISGDGKIDETEAEKLQQILPALNQRNLSQLSPEERYDDWKQISELVKTWDTSKSANENLQSIVAAPAPPTESEAIVPTPAPAPAPAPDVVKELEDAGIQEVEPPFVDVYPAPTPAPAPAPAPEPARVISVDPDSGMGLVITPDGMPKIVSVPETTKPGDVIEVTPEPTPAPAPAPIGTTTVLGEDGSQLIVDQEGNLVDIIPPETPSETPAVPPFQGPMGPPTEDIAKRYSDEFAKYLDYLQAGQPAPPKYEPPPFNEPGPYWEEFDQNLKQMMDEGRLPSQWQQDDEGNYTFVSDDGSTLTLGPNGDVVDYTEAPQGNLPGEVPEAVMPSVPPPAPPPASVLPPIAPPAVQPPVVKPPSLAPAPAAQSGMDVNGLLALLGLMGESQAQPQTPAPEYAKTLEFDVTKAFSPTLYEEEQKQENPYLRGLI